MKRKSLDGRKFGILGIVFSILFISLAVATITQQTSPFYVDLDSSQNLVTYYKNEFNDGTTEKDVTGTGAWSDVVYIRLPKNAEILDARFDVTGLPTLGNILGNLTLEDIGDAYVNSSSPDTNYGSNEYLVIFEDTSGVPPAKYYHSYIMFNFSFLNKSYLISNAKLYFYHDPPGANEGDIDVYILNSGSWNESIITWNNRPTNTTYITTVYCPQWGGDVVVSGQVLVDKLNEHLSDNNVTIVLKPPELSYYIRLDSKEYSDNSRHPYLNVTYGEALFPKNIIINIGSDNSVEWSKSEELNTTDTVINITAFQNYLSTCTPTNGYCDVPINVSATDGKLRINNINITYKINASDHFTVSSLKWYQYNEIVANQTYDKIKEISNTGTPVGEDLAVSGYNISGTSCKVNGTAYTVSGGVCLYSHTITQGSLWDFLKFWDSAWGSGTPVIQTESSPESGVGYWKKNITISYYLPDGSTAPAGTFTNITTQTICLSSNITTGEYIKYWNGTDWVDITPTQTGVWEEKTVGSKTFWVIKDDFCNGDGVLDFKVKIASNE